ncbi:MAG TPA: hypothetical protein VI685_21185, partial [Candidatus Angelobacter sp.]
QNLPLIVGQVHFRVGGRTGSELLLYLHVIYRRINMFPLVTIYEIGSSCLVALSRNGRKSQQLVDLISPFFDRLRFFPVSDSTPIVPSPTVHRYSVAQSIAALEERRQQVHVEQMIESLRVWQPLYDQTVSLFLETVEDDLPCRQYPGNWRMRAKGFLQEYARRRETHKLCRKPDKPKENFFRLRGYLKKCVDNPGQIGDPDRRVVRHILRCYSSRHGAPGSEQFAKRREEQARIANLPTYGQLSQVLIARLQQFPAEGGVVNFDSVAPPIKDDESGRFKVPAGAVIPDCLAGKARRCWDAPIEKLVQEGVIPSGEVLAQVLPQITSQVRAAGIRGQNLRRCYAAVYSAFRRRRSLLLLNLERQVRFEDLPWIKVLSDLRQDGLKAKDEAYQVLEEVSTIALVSFPYAILPNKLLQELRTLAKAAGLDIPIVDELAADIFMGAFTEKFLAAAKIAAEMLRGSFYERYYGLDYRPILQMDNIQERHGAKISPEFAALCQELAQVKNDEGWSVSRNGKIIEQSQILTTQNLAPLFAALSLRSALSGRVRELSEQCLRWILRRQTSTSWKANLRMVKNSAYAWRQMVFFLSLLDSSEIRAFIQWTRAEAVRQKSTRAEQFESAVAGLELVVNGGSIDQQDVQGAFQARRFLGWTTGRHWLLGPEQKKAAL